MKHSKTIFNRVTQQISFPNLITVDSLKSNQSYKSLRVKSIQKNKQGDLIEVQIKFEIKQINNSADVYLYLDDCKKDMFYSVPSGNYEFNLKLKKGSYSINIFYVENGYKSPSFTKNLMI